MGVFQSFFKRHDYYKFHSIAMLPFVPCVAAILWNALDVLVSRVIDFQQVKCASK
jgi:hypothetical protein